MKLIFCPECHDVVKLDLQPRLCKCRASSGRYLDDINAVYHGEAIPLGILNSELARAVRNHSGRFAGDPALKFTAFVVPDDSDTFTRSKR